MIVEYSQKGKIHGSRNGTPAQPGQQTPDAALAGAAPGAEGQQMTRTERIKRFRRQMLRQRLADIAAKRVAPLLLLTGCLTAVCWAMNTDDGATFMAMWMLFLLCTFGGLQLMGWIRSRG